MPRLPGIRAGNFYSRFLFTDFYKTILLLGFHFLISRNIFFYPESKMFLRKKTECNNNYCSKYLRNRRKKMHVLHQHIYNRIIQEKIDSDDQDVSYQLHAPAQVGTIEYDKFR